MLPSFRLKCLIIEDEPLAAGILRGYIADTLFLELAADCRDALQAIEVLHTQSIDIVFLDIHLPKMSGLDFLNSQRPAPYVIITSAYPDYALSGYEFSVSDYLLKPIAFERFLKAVTKVLNKEKEQEQVALPLRAESAARVFHFFNVNKKMQKVWVDEILYVESMKEYCSIYLVSSPSRPVVTKMQLQDMEKLLGEQDFLRIHRSYLVAIAKIEVYDASEIIIANIALPIGRSYKEGVLQRLQ